MPRKKLPVILELEEAQNLLKQPNKRDPTGLRNKAMLSLMLHCGLRVFEVINLKPGNINLTPQRKTQGRSWEREKGQRSCHTGLPSKPS